MRHAVAAAAACMSLRTRGKILPLVCTWNASTSQKTNRGPSTNTEYVHITHRTTQDKRPASEDTLEVGPRQRDTLQRSLAHVGLQQSTSSRGFAF
jgi:hypothetical protein